MIEKTNLISVNELISTFNEIRDIPYRIPLTLEDEDSCCSGKATKMKGFLDSQGYISRYRICKFKWSDLDLPDTITKVTHQDDSTHVYIEIFINNRWINIDPTWDSFLFPAFKISHWNGIDSTLTAVNSRGLLDDETSKSIMENPDNNEILKDLAINGEFYKAFNLYLQRIREEN